MTTRIPLAAVAALALGIAPTAHAEKKPVAHAPIAAHAATDTAAAAKSALARLANAYKTGQTISYTSTVTMNIPTGPGTPPTPTTVTVKGLVSRPNLFRMETSQSGRMTALLVSDGKTVSVYDPSQSKYAKSDAGTTAIETVGIAQRAGAGLFGQAGITKFVGAMVMPEIFFSAQPDLGAAVPGPGIRYSAHLATVDGAQTLRVAQRLPGRNGSSALFLFFLDPATGLPKRFAQDLDAGPRSLELIREDYSDFQIGGTLAADAFAWTPPATATLAAAPAPPSPQGPALLATGTAAPDFSVQTPDGKTVKLSDYAGKVVVIDFWATWCGPCQRSLPYTDKISQAYAPKGVVFVPICSWDDQASFTDWVGKHKNLTMPFYFDPVGKDEGNSIAVKSYNVSGIPTQYVVGKDGKVVTSFVGYDADNDPTEKGLQQALDKALAGS